jgi:hypothetical protein
MLRFRFGMKEELRKYRKGTEVESACNRSRSRVMRGDESPRVDVDRGRLPVLESVKG